MTGIVLLPVVPLEVGVLMFVMVELGGPSMLHPALVPDSCHAIYERRRSEDSVRSRPCARMTALILSASTRRFLSQGTAKKGGNAQIVAGVEERLCTVALVKTEGAIMAAPAL